MSRSTQKQRHYGICKVLAQKIEMEPDSIDDEIKIRREIEKIKIVQKKELMRIKREFENSKYSQKTLNKKAKKSDFKVVDLSNFRKKYLKEIEELGNVTAFLPCVRCMKPCITTSDLVEHILKEHPEMIKDRMNPPYSAEHQSDYSENRMNPAFKNEAKYGYDITIKKKKREINKETE